jgi:hypothetical protein
MPTSMLIRCGALPSALGQPSHQRWGRRRLGNARERSPVHELARGVQEAVNLIGRPIMETTKAERLCSLFRAPFRVFERDGWSLPARALVQISALPTKQEVSLME